MNGKNEWNTINTRLAFFLQGRKAQRRAGKTDEEGSQLS